MGKRSKGLPMVALLVNPNMTFLTQLQHALTSRGIACIVARDLATALLAITQHEFDVAIINSRISEEGDGWALGGVMRKISDAMYIAMTCNEKDVLAIQSTINNRLNEIFDNKVDTEDVASAVAAKLAPAAGLQRVN
jgi:DNA-binding NtrC family response regulator